MLQAEIFVSTQCSREGIRFDWASPGYFYPRNLGVSRGGTNPIPRPPICLTYASLPFDVRQENLLSGRGRLSGKTLVQGVLKTLTFVLLVRLKIPTDLSFRGPCPPPLQEFLDPPLKTVQLYTCTTISLIHVLPDWGTLWLVRQVHTFKVTASVCVK